VVGEEVLDLAEESRVAAARPVEELAAGGGRFDLEGVEEDLLGAVGPGVHGGAPEA
jgi:hypothetical protein